MKKGLILSVLALILLSVPSVVFSEEEPVQGGGAPILSTILNIFPGVGLGSFLAKDWAGGAIQAGGELAGAGLLGYGLILAEGAMESGSDNAALSGTLIISGAILWLGAKIFGIVRPRLFLRIADDDLPSGNAPFSICQGLPEKPVVTDEKNGPPETGQRLFKALP